MTPVEEFRAAVFSSLAQANRLPVEEHARRAHCAGGPSIEELKARISAHRSGVPLRAVA